MSKFHFDTPDGPNWNQVLPKGPRHRPYLLIRCHLIIEGFCSQSQFQNRDTVFCLKSVETAKIYSSFFNHQSIKIPNRKNSKAGAVLKTQKTLKLLGQAADEWINSQYHNLKPQEGGKKHLSFSGVVPIWPIWSVKMKF